MPRWSYLAIFVSLLLANGGAGGADVETANDSATTTPVEAKSAPTNKDNDERLTFNFRNQPWQDVLDWFAEQAGLSLHLEAPPPGTFNYRDTRSYTPAEALDVLNSILLTKGYTLVRRDRLLVLVNLEDGVPPNLVPDVPLEELDQRGEYELVRVLFPVWNMTPEQAAEEVQPILGPQGKVVTLPQARQIQVTETAGRLRTIRSIINAIEQPDGGAAGLREFELKYITFDAAMPTIRQMLGIPTDAYSTPDGTVQITKSGAPGEKLLFRGTAQHAARLAEILRLIDVPEAARGIEGAPQLEVYPIATADPEAVVKVLQTLLRNDPNVVLTTDPQTGYVIAYATPPQQATIRATIEQMQRDARQVDVIALSNVDPQVAVLAINKLFGGTGEEPDPKAPRVDADINSRSLLVRGTKSQVEQIRAMLRKLGETEEEGVATRRSGQHVRLLPLAGPAARSAIGQIEQIWSSVRPNQIRVIAPSAAIPTYRPSEGTSNGPTEQPATTRHQPVEDAAELRELWQMMLNRPQNTETDEPPLPSDEHSAPHEHEKGDELKPLDNTSAAITTTARFRFAADQLQQPPKDSNDAPSTTQPASPSRGAPIVIAPGPGGTLIASDDLEALDELEEMLSAVASRSLSSGREYAVFYLKYAKAGAIAEVLAAIFGGSTTGNDRGLIGDLATNALGDVGGALMGDLLLGGGRGGAFTSASVDVIPDARLNALVVRARPADLDTIEQLLKVLDQRTGPDNVEADGQPRPIPVYNTSATEIAQIVSQVYQDRVTGAGAVMSPQEMMRMLRGGPSSEQQVQKMSLAVDTRNNMLIVRAPDPLFEEVKALVAELDQSLADSPQTTRVVSLRHTNSAAVQKALTSILDNVRTNTTTASSGETRRGDNEEDSPEERARRAIRRNWEMMQEMRRLQERLGGEGGDRSRFFERFRGRGGPGGNNERRN